MKCPSCGGNCSYKIDEGFICSHCGNKYSRTQNNDKGYVIDSIVSGIDSVEGMNFAIPSNTIIEFIKANYIDYTLA